MKKALSILLSFLMILTVLPMAFVPAFAEDDPPAPGIEWSYDENTKTLTFTGAGPMTDYAPNGNVMVPETPWSAYADEAEAAVIGDGITSVGDYSFATFTKLAQVTLAATVTSIGTGAFTYCFELAEINLPAGLTEIGKGAFLFNKLSNVAIPAGVTSLDSVFSCNLAPLSITLPEGLTSITDCFDQTVIENLTIPSTVTVFNSNGDYEVKILNVKNLVNNSAAVAVSDSLASTNGDNVEDFFYIESMEYRVNLSYLRTGTPPSEEEMYPFYVDFYNRILGTNFSTYEEMMAAFNNNEFTEEQLARIEEIENVMNITDAPLPSVKIYCLQDSAEHEALRANGFPHYIIDNGNALCEEPVSMKCGDDLAWSIEGDTLVITGKGAMYDEYRGWLFYRNDVNNVRFEEVGGAITYIGAYALRGFGAFDTVSLPAGVASFGYGWLDDDAVGTLHLPAGFSCFDDSQSSSAFNSYCNSISAYSVEEGNAVYSSDGGSLYGRHYGQNWLLRAAAAADTIRDDTDVIGAYAFYNDASLTDVTIPASVCELKVDAFSSCKNLSAVTIAPASHALNISLSAFQYCGSLASFSVDAADTRFAVQDGVLYTKDMTKVAAVPFAITELTLPATVTGIANPNSQSAYSGGAGLRKLTVMNNEFDFGYGSYSSTSAFTMASLQDHSAIEICGNGGSTAETFAMKNGFTFVALDGVTIESVEFDISGVPAKAVVGTHLSFGNWNITAVATYSDGSVKELSYNNGNSDLRIYYKYPGSNYWNENNWASLENGEGEYLFEVRYGTFKQAFTITVGQPDYHFEFDTSTAVTVVEQYTDSYQYSDYTYNAGNILGVELYKVYDDPDLPREQMYIGNNVTVRYSDDKDWSNLMSEEPGVYDVTFRFSEYALTAETTIQVTVVPGDVTLVVDLSNVPTEVEQFGSLTNADLGIVAKLITAGGREYDVSDRIHFYSFTETEENSGAYDSVDTSTVGARRINAYLNLYQYGYMNDEGYSRYAYVYKSFDPIYVQVVQGEYDHIRIEVPEELEIEKDYGVDLLNYVKAYKVYADNTEEEIADKTGFRFEGYSASGGTYTGHTTWMYSYGDVIEYTVTFADQTASMRVRCVQRVAYEITATADAVDAWPARYLSRNEIGLTVTRTYNGETEDITDAVTLDFNYVSNPGSMTVRVYYRDPAVDNADRMIGEVNVIAKQLTTFEVRGLPASLTLDRYAFYDLSNVKIYAIKDGVETEIDNTWFSFRMERNDGETTYAGFVDTQVPGTGTLYVYGNYGSEYVPDSIVANNGIPVTVEDAELVLEGAQTEVEQWGVYALTGEVYTRNLATGVLTPAVYESLDYRTSTGVVNRFYTGNPGKYELTPYVYIQYLGNVDVTPITVTVVCTEHDLVPTEAVSATCTEPGSIAYWTCSVCEKIFADENGATEITPADTVIPAGHALTEHPGAQATCTENGNLPYYECENCGKFFVDGNAENEIVDHSEVILPAHHTLEAHPEKAAACTENGNIAYWYCTACCKYFSDEAAENEIALGDTVIPGGHAMEHHAAVPATCTENGNIEYWFCTVCRKYFTDAAGATEISESAVSAGALSHSWGAWTKLSDTEHQRVCANNPEHVEKAAHSWNGGSVTQQPTCTAKGVKTFTCTVCGATRTEEIATVGHKDDNKDGWCDFGCGTAMGTQPSNPGTPSQPSDSGKCKYCGETHTGFWGKIVQFFHNIAYFFRNLFRR